MIVDMIAEGDILSIRQEIIVYFVFLLAIRTVSQTYKNEERKTIWSIKHSLSAALM